jgi:hypothetical protein
VGKVVASGLQIPFYLDTSCARHPSGVRARLEPLCATTIRMRWAPPSPRRRELSPPRPSLRPGPTCAVGADHSNSLAGAPLATDASYLSPDSIHAPNSPGTATTPSSCLLASWRGRRASAWLLWQIQFCARLCSIRLTLPVPRSRRYGPRNQGRSASRPGTHLC